jgi:hypothetical protein
MALCKHGPDGACGCKTVVRDMCMTHYRRWRAGKPLDSPVRATPDLQKGRTEAVFQLLTGPRRLDAPCLLRRSRSCGVWASASLLQPHTRRPRRPGR